MHARVNHRSIKPRQRRRLRQLAAEVSGLKFKHNLLWHFFCDVVALCAKCTQHRASARTFLRRIKQCISHYHHETRIASRPRGRAIAAGPLPQRHARGGVARGQPAGTDERQVKHVARVLFFLSFSSLLLLLQESTHLITWSCLRETFGTRFALKTIKERIKVKKDHATPGFST